MKFETILDAYAMVSEELGGNPWIGDYSFEKMREINRIRGRQRDAFRARLVKMYKTAFLDGYEKCALDRMLIREEPK